jgi:hypothetical protein
MALGLASCSFPNDRRTSCGGGIIQPHYQQTHFLAFEPGVAEFGGRRVNSAAGFAAAGWAPAGFDKWSAAAQH